MTRLKVIGMMLGLVLVSATEGVATEGRAERCLDTVCFPTSARIGSEEVPLLGAALFRYWMFDVYTAALYAPKSWQEARAVGTDGPSEIVIEYHREISAEDIAKSAEEQLRKQNKFIPQPIWQDITELHRQYRDVMAGDRYRLRYEPGKGATLYLNDSLVSSISNPEFAKIYFRIWLDNNSPLDRTLRDEMFGGAVSSNDKGV